MDWRGSSSNRYRKLLLKLALQMARDDFDPGAAAG
jgi:hypothetical protein